MEIIVFVPVRDSTLLVKSRGFIRKVSFCTRGRLDNSPLSCVFGQFMSFCTRGEHDFYKEYGEKTAFLLVCNAIIGRKCVFVLGENTTLLVKSRGFGQKVLFCTRGEIKCCTLPSE